MKNYALVFRTKMCLFLLYVWMYTKLYVLNIKLTQIGNDGRDSKF